MAKQYTYQPGDKLVRYNAEEWSALYLNGLLVSKGDSYLVDEWIETYLGVERHDDDAFITDDRKGVYETLAEVEENELKRLKKARTAQELREQAAALIAQADALSK